MELPGSIKVGALPYAVSATGKEWSLAHKSWGCINSGECTIHLVAEDRPAAAVAVTMLHELIHACYHHAGASGKLGEEDAAIMISSGLGAILADNPGLVAWLAEAFAQRKGEQA